MTFGVAQYSDAEDIQGTIRRADMALLQGKNNGRNQVVAFLDATNEAEICYDPRGGIKYENQR